MCRILLLTKCVYANQELEQTIRRLGHEVLSSVSLIDLIKNGQVPKEFIREFHPILLSETISNEERKAIVKQLSTERTTIVQLIEPQFSKEEQLMKQEEKNERCLSIEAPLEIIREILSIEPPNSQNDNIFMMAKHGTYSTEELLTELQLTKLERRLLEELVEAKGSTLSREELCRLIWKTEPSQSMQSQLSSLVRKIKEKLEGLGFNSNCLQTQWGQGYLLDLTMLQRQQHFSESIIYNVQ